MKEYSNTIKEISSQVPTEIKSLIKVQECFGWGWKMEDDSVCNVANICDLSSFCKSTYELHQIRKSSNHDGIWRDSVGTAKSESYKRNRVSDKLVQEFIKTLGHVPILPRTWRSVLFSQYMKDYKSALLRVDTASYITFMYKNPNILFRVWRNANTKVNIDISPKLVEYLVNAGFTIRDVPVGSLAKAPECKNRISIISDERARSAATAIREFISSSST